MEYKIFYNKLTQDPDYKDYLSAAQKRPEIMEKLREKYLKTTHVSYVEKVVRCEKLMESSSYQQIEGKKILKLHTPLRQELFILNIIDVYTNIDVNYAKGMELFDEMHKDDMIDFLLAMVPDSERKMFDSIMNMVVDDFMTNNCSIVGYLDTRMSAIELAINGLVDTLNSIANNPEIIAKVNAQKSE